MTPGLVAAMSAMTSKITLREWGLVDLKSTLRTAPSLVRNLFIRIIACALTSECGRSCAADAGYRVSFRP